ncbi:MAG: DUF899 domain-containing protein [Pseudomonadales bacterium]
MATRKTVSKADWLKAREEFLLQEKAFTRERDALSTARQALPRWQVDEDYEFHSQNGLIKLSELFDGHSQLITQHFMFGPDWDEGCPSCSFWADGYEGTAAHLRARDINMVAVSNAPLQSLEAYKERMGWTFPWYSSLGSSFNFDFGVSFTAEQLEGGENNYNYGTQRFNGAEAPGMSVFELDQGGAVFHTYSAYSRGLDMFNATYHYMDAVPKGRDEDELPFSMAWLRRRDSY